MLDRGRHLTETALGQLWDSSGTALGQLCDSSGTALEQLWHDDDDDDDLRLSILYIQTPDQPPQRPLCYCNKAVRHSKFNLHLIF